ncbi:hypothetical protein [Nitratireductor sp. StC3]|uniref:helix-turn-helix transcriptional regulator n=1 Tax=Nitratireductor sp. StC3 TaxID=2126741 RepID=UPI000D0CF8B0|nr:hypothetical protein [Nitratireductor sp. StC3]PSM20212.1 hypothetical protein C7T96_03975 [Nitratireductor sp. StC3]
MKPGLHYAPLGMSREEAARYVGVGTTTFDRMVAEGVMPRPKRYRGRVLWNRVALELAFEDLPENEGNMIDKILGL